MWHHGYYLFFSCRHAHRRYILWSQSLPPRSYLYRDGKRYQMWAMSSRHGGQRHPLHRHRWGRAHHRKPTARLFLCDISEIYSGGALVLFVGTQKLSGWAGWHTLHCQWNCDINPSYASVSTCMWKSVDVWVWKDVWKDVYLIGFMCLGGILTLPGW